MAGTSTLGLIGRLPLRRCSGASSWSLRDAAEDLGREDLHLVLPTVLQRAFEPRHVDRVLGHLDQALVLEQLVMIGLTRR